MVQLLVQGAQVRDGGAALGGAVQAVVGLGQALVVQRHHVRAVRVVLLPDGVQRGVGLPVGREGEVLETRRRRVVQVVLHGRRKHACPDFMHARL